MTPLITSLEQAGEGSLADLIDRLTLYEHCEGYDGKDWEKIASEAAEAIRALAASTPVGGLGALHALRPSVPTEQAGWPVLADRERLAFLIRGSIGEYIIGQRQADKAADFIISEGRDEPADGCSSNEGAA